MCIYICYSVTTTMPKTKQIKKLLTIATTKGDITCSVTPCIGISLNGSSREYYSTSYSVSINGKIQGYYDKSVWLYEGIDSKGRTIKIAKRGFSIDSLFPDLEFSSPEQAKASIATIKAGMEKTISANNWNIVDTKA